MKCAISVLIPVYNAAKWLPDCLKSLCLQTFTDFEIICLNDASNDDSLEILREFAGKEPRLRIIDSASNQGASVSRNRLLQEAQGEYVAFIDADDCVLPSYLEKLYHAAKKHQADVTKCLLYELTDAGEMRLPANNGLILTEHQMNSLTARFLSAYSRHEVWAKLFRTQFLRDNRFEFVKGHYWAQDVSFSCLAFVLAHRLAFVQEPLYIYRVGLPNSIMGQKGRFITVDVLRELLFLRSQLKHVNVWDKDLAHEWTKKTIWRLGMLCKFPEEYRQEGMPLRQQVFTGMREDLSLYGFVPRLRWGSLLAVEKLLKGKGSYLLCKIWR